MRMNSLFEKEDLDLKRPYIPPVLCFALCTWVLLAICIEFLSKTVVNLWFVLLVALFSLIVSLVSKKYSHNYIKAVLLSISVSLIISGFYCSQFQYAYDVAHNPENAYEMTFKIEEDPVFNKVYVSANSLILDCSNKLLIGKKVELRFPADKQIQYGNCIRVNNVSFSSSEQDYQSLLSSGVIATAYIKDYEEKDDSFFHVVYQCRANTLMQISSGVENENDKAIMKALICGYKRDLYSSNIYDTYKTSGLAHIVAVSGAHLSIVCGMLLVVSKALRISRRKTICLEFLFVLLYLLFTGFQISTLRAALMTLTGISSFFFGRRPASLNALGVCLILIFILGPYNALSISLLLSASSTLSIVIFTNYFLHLFECSKRANRACGVTKPNPLLSSFAMSCAANITSMPLSAGFFSQVSIVGLLSNILANFIFVPICVLGSFISLIGLFTDEIAIHLFASLSIFAKALNAIAFDFSQIPGCAKAIFLDSIMGITVAILFCMIIYALWTKIKIRHYLILFVLIAGYIYVSALFNIDTRIIIQDVGQGDSILIQSSGQTALIDTGKNDSLLKESLGKYSISNIDLLLISHPDSDHIDSLDVIDALTTVNTVALSSVLKNSSSQKTTDLICSINQIKEARIVYVNPGDSIRIGEIEILVLGPYKETDSSGNQDSLSLLIYIDWNQDGKQDFCMLSCGDAEADMIETYLQDYGISEIDVLKVSHHGSKESLSEEIVSSVDVDVAVISVGENNSYGHPSDVALALLDKMNAKIFRTDLNGDIIIYPTETKLKVTTVK